MTIEIEHNYPADFLPDDQTIIENVIHTALDYEKCPYEVQVFVLLTDDEEIRQMNRDHRGIDRATDVLSFPTVSYEQPGDFSVIESQKNDLIDPDTGHIMFGDIVINENRVRSQALEFGHSTRREFSFLVAHSMLHLCGYDHMEEEEARVMEEKQEKALTELGITRN